MNENEIELREEKSSSAPAKGLSALALAGLGLAGGWIVYSRTMIDHDLPLPLAIDSEKHLFTSGFAGLLSYYVDKQGSGRPLVLIHSVNAAASSYEMRPLFNHYRGQRPVYALDLPGFGFSERSDRRYSPELFTAAVRDFLKDIVGEPADVVALSLGGEFAARAALDNPELFHSLTLISPTGLSSDSRKNGAQQAGGSPLPLFSFPLWSQAFYDLLATRTSIRYYLNKSFHGDVDDGMVAYSYLSSHQPNARFAPLHFISGLLFTPRVREEVYQNLQVPGLIIYDRDPFTGFDELPSLLLSGANWSAARVAPTSGLPQFEELETTTRVLDNFWQGLDK